MKTGELLLFIIIVSIFAIFLMGADVIEIPYFISKSLLRMICAYILTLIFSISFAILMAHNHTASKILFPIMDILQSIPILGFLPFAMLFFIHLFPVYGTELVSIFLLFTSMTWSVLFNTIEGIKTIPNKLSDVAKLTNVKGLDYLFHIVFPAIYPPLISGSITGWGGAWYFLVVGEYLIFANEIYSLDGIGSFISKSAYSGNIALSILGIGILACVVLSINKFIWQPLLFKARKYSYGRQDDLEGEDSRVIPKLEIFYERYIKNFALTNSFLRNTLEKILKFFDISPKTQFDEIKKISSAFVLQIAILFGLIIFGILFTTSNMITFSSVFFASLYTAIRIGIAYSIALFWTLSVAILIAKKTSLLKYLMPIFDVGQSIPAVAIFPIIVVFLINSLGNGSVAIEIASILLIMTGVQWYLLFNFIRAIRAIPSEINDLGRMISIDKKSQIKEIILPAITPAIIVGSLEATAGGLNATVISENIVYDNQVYSTLGLGYLMSQGAAVGDTTAIIISVLAMMIMVLLVNRLVWKRMLSAIEKYKFVV